MTMRTVQIGLATYTDTAGQRRIGQQGEQVDVAADDTERFDMINSGTAARAPEAKPAPRKAAPKRKAAPRKTAHK